MARRVTCSGTRQLPTMRLKNLQNMRICHVRM
jgi:hypothetical protein